MIFFALLVFCYSTLSARATSLIKLSVTRDTSSVSGISSDGYFATQFHVAFSASVNGIGSFSCCPYLSSPLGLDVPAILAATIELAEDEAIDPITEIYTDQLYLRYESSTLILCKELSSPIFQL